MKLFSQNTEEMARLLVKRYPDMDTVTLMKIIEDVRHLHMQMFLKERNREVQMRGYQMDN